MASASLKSSVRAAVVCCGAGFALCFAPQSVTEPIRTHLRDAARPGQIVARVVVDFCQSELRHLDQNRQRDSRIAALQSEVNARKLRAQRLQIENALLHERLADIQKLGFAPYRSTERRPLIDADLLTARVLGEETAGLWRAGQMLDQGKFSGVRESALVLEDAGLLIDQGADGDMATGQPVYSGRCVVGKIARVGHFSSTVQLVSDPEFRALAQLARQTTEGPAFGAEGILKGQGEELCRLTLINSTDPVEVGNVVYSGDRDGVLPFPMRYGTVVKAELKPGAPHWDILVKPAVSGVRQKTVQVLRMMANPIRVLGQ